MAAPKAKVRRHTGKDSTTGTALPAADAVETPSAEAQILQKRAVRIKPKGELTHKTRKAISLVLDHGVEPKEAMILTGCTKSVNPQRISDFKRKVEKYSLQRPSMQKLANKVVEDVLKGKERTYTTQKMNREGQVVEISETMSPTHTNQLAAAAMVYDRVEPIVRMNQNLNVNVDCSPVDLSKYRNR